MLYYTGFRACAITSPERIDWADLGSVVSARKSAEVGCEKLKVNIVDGQVRVTWKKLNVGAMAIFEVVYFDKANDDHRKRPKKVYGNVESTVQCFDTKIILVRAPQWSTIVVCVIFSFLILKDLYPFIYNMLPPEEAESGDRWATILSSIVPGLTVAVLVFFYNLIHWMRFFRVRKKQT